VSPADEIDYHAMAKVGLPQKMRKSLPWIGQQILFILFKFLLGSGTWWFWNANAWYWSLRWVLRYNLKECAHCYWLDSFAAKLPRETIVSNTILAESHTDNHI